MNPIAIVHVFTGVLVMTLCVPLIRRKVKRNPWYGIRVRDAFVSEERWAEINSYGGRVMAWWAGVIGITGIIGLTLPSSLWAAYVWSSLAIVIGSLLVATFLITRFAKGTSATKTSNNP